MSERDRLLGLDDEALLAECEVDRMRGSGAGGQKRNKTENAVRVRHRQTGVQGLVASSRSQHRNRRQALEQLRRRLAIELREPVDVTDYAPSAELSALLAAPLPARWRAEKPQAYLLAVAELIDVFAEVGCGFGDWVRTVGAGASAVSRVIDGDDELWRHLNELRAGVGLRPLRGGR